MERTSEDGTFPRTSSQPAGENPYEKSSLSFDLEKAVSLNATPTHFLKDGSLVRFCGMIQDMYDPEFYLDEYEVTVKSSNTRVMKKGTFRDIIDCHPDIEIHLDSPRNVTKERQVFYCISVPAENDWVRKHKFTENCCKTNVESSTSLNNVGESSVGQKRPLENECVTKDTRSSQNDITHDPTSAENMENTKRARTKLDEGNDCPDKYLNNHHLPIPDDDALACIVKVYDNRKIDLVLNEVYEFCGLLSVDPGQTALPTVCDEDYDMDIDDFQSQHLPPPSKVPRLHVIDAKKLKHTNPLVSQDIMELTHMTELQQIVKEAAQTRDHLQSILQQVLCGDVIAADYLICHLVSSVYARKEDTLCLGKFSLNLTNINQTEEKFGKQLYEEIIQKITTKSHFLSITPSTLNQSTLTPRKDYATNSLHSGLLQLSDTTHLVVDETAMTPTQLDAKGAHNVSALKQLIACQNVTYDFQFNELKFTSDVPVLLLSEGKSLFGADCIIPVENLNKFDEEIQTFEAIRSYATPTLLDNIRIYLTVMKLLNYTLSEEMKKIIQNDFVHARQQCLNEMTSDDLHNLLVFARLLSISYGETSLSESMWERAKVLEVERKKRLDRYSI